MEEEMDDMIVDDVAVESDDDIPVKNTLKKTFKKRLEKRLEK